MILTENYRFNRKLFSDFLEYLPDDGIQYLISKQTILTIESFIMSALGETHLQIDLTTPARRTTIQNKVTGNQFELLDETYAVLSTDSNSPLSRVSVAASSLSYDSYRGCTYGCAYCHVQGSIAELKDLKMLSKPERASTFTMPEILEALVDHSLFVPGETIISIGTSSTEPLAEGAVVRDTMAFCRLFRHRGFTNPIWIVTKAGFPTNELSTLSRIADKGPVILSFTHGALNREIEPVQNDRFLNLGKVVEHGAHAIVYLRPLVKEWGSNEITIRSVLEHARSSLAGNRLAAICPGGIRWTPGIEHGLNNRGILWPETIHRHDNQKVLPEEIYNIVMNLTAEIFPGTPILLHSSCGLARALNISNQNLVQIQNRADCTSSRCPSFQRAACQKAALKILSAPMEELNHIPFLKQNQVQLTRIDESGIHTKTPLNDLGKSILPKKIARFALVNVNDGQVVNKKSAEKGKLYSIQNLIVGIRSNAGIDEQTLILEDALKLGICEFDLACGDGEAAKIFSERRSPDSAQKYISVRLPDDALELMPNSESLAQQIAAYWKTIQDETKTIELSTVLLPCSASSWSEVAVQEFLQMLRRRTGLKRIRLGVLLPDTFKGKLPCNFDVIEVSATAQPHRFVEMATNSSSELRLRGTSLEFDLNAFEEFIRGPFDRLMWLPTSTQLRGVIL